MLAPPGTARTPWKIFIGEAFCWSCSAQLSQHNGAIPRERGSKGTGRDIPSWHLQLPQPCQQEFSNFHACSDGRVLTIQLTARAAHFGDVPTISRSSSAGNGSCPAQVPRAAQAVPAALAVPRELSLPWMGFKIPPNPTQPGILYFSAQMTPQ